MNRLIAYKLHMPNMVANAHNSNEFRAIVGYTVSLRLAIWHGSRGWLSQESACLESIGPEFRASVLTKAEHGSVCP